MATCWTSCITQNLLDECAEIFPCGWGCISDEDIPILHKKPANSKNNKPSARQLPLPNMAVILRFVMCFATCFASHLPHNELAVASLMLCVVASCIC